MSQDGGKGWKPHHLSQIREKHLSIIIPGTKINQQFFIRISSLTKKEGLTVGHREVGKGFHLDTTN